MNKTTPNNSKNNESKIPDPPMYPPSANSNVTPYSTSGISVSTLNNTPRTSAVKVVRIEAPTGLFLILTVSPKKGC